ncbi:LOW QUALITY PROTEIN: sperm flagellar protein 2-like [Ctenodactylus gundi]
MVGDWALPEEMVDNLPPSNNSILGHVLYRLAEKSLPPQVELTEPELTSFAIKGCLLGKTLSGKTTTLKALQKDFPIQVLSIDTLVQEAIQAFHNNEQICGDPPVQKEEEGKVTPAVHEVSEPKTKQTNKEASTSINETPNAEEDKLHDSFSKLTARAQLGAKSEQLLKKGKSVPDTLLVSIMVNAINEIPASQGWVLDGFPMTLNQAQLLDEALTGYNRNVKEQEGKKTPISTLAVDPTASKEVPLPSPVFDFVILLDISDTFSLNRMNDIMAEEFSRELTHKQDGKQGAAENQEEEWDQNLRDQIQNRIVGFLDNWPLLEQWFSEPENILIKINAEIDKEFLCRKVREIFATETVKKKKKDSPKGKTPGGKTPAKKSPVGSTEVAPPPLGLPPPKPGSEEWVYVSEPVPEEVSSFLVPYWELIENSYITTIKTVLRHLREDQHAMFTYLHVIKQSFWEFLRRPDCKQDFVSQWQADFNALPEDLWDDEETKAELHQRLNDLRDRLWDICDTRKEDAEQERLDIIHANWLQDFSGMTINHFFSLMQAELKRFQDTKRLLQDYYRTMECKIPVEDSRRHTQLPLVQVDGKDISESQLRLPVVSRISISPETWMPKPKVKASLKGKINLSLENIESNLEADEKLVMDTWQQASSAVSQMVAAEIHQRLLEEESEKQLADLKEKSLPVNANKKVKKEKESPKKKKEDKKPKGKSPPLAEAVSATVAAAEDLNELEKKNELKLRIKEEHLAALQFEEIATQFRLELIKTKALSVLEDLVTKTADVYKSMGHWLGERYLNEMASIEKLTEVARYHIETATKIQNELYLDQEDFFINVSIKVFPDPVPPKRPPPTEKEENGTLTIEQLDNLREQFLDMAPKGLIGSKTFTDILLDLVTLNLGTNNLPSSWMYLSQSDLQELTSLLTVNSEFVDWRKFLLVAAMPWPLPSEEELLRTLQRFKEVDEEQTGTVTFEQYMQAGLWFTGYEVIKIPEDPLEPLPFKRHEHLIQFFFRLFADYQKDPPSLDYTQMLLYFGCHPDAVEGVYRALSVAVGTHIFRQAEIMMPAGKDFSRGMSPTEEIPELDEDAAREEKKLKEKTDVWEQKTEEIPENINTEKISMETLMSVFRGRDEAQEATRFVSHPKIENIYSEGFIKTFKDLDAKNLEPIEIALLLKHLFIQDLIANYSDYKIPDIKAILQRSEHVRGSDGEGSPRLTEEKKWGQRPVSTPAVPFEDLLVEPSFSPTFTQGQSHENKGELSEPEEPVYDHVGDAAASSDGESSTDSSSDSSELQVLPETHQLQGLTDSMKHLMDQLGSKPKSSIGLPPFPSVLPVQSAPEPAAPPLGANSFSFPPFAPWTGYTSSSPLDTGQQKGVMTYLC